MKLSPVVTSRLGLSKFFFTVLSMLFILVAHISAIDDTLEDLRKESQVTAESVGKESLLHQEPESNPPADIEKRLQVVEER